MSRVLFAVAAALPLWAYFYQDSVSCLYPYLHMINGDRNETVAAWAKYCPLDTRIVYPPTPVPEIAAEDYSYDALRVATRDFRSPAVVRGLFKNTKAVESWNSRDYLPEAFGDFAIPVVQDGRVGTLQDDRIVETFSESFREVYDADFTKKYLFFPVKSRFMFNGSDAGKSEALQDQCNTIVKRDLELGRIFPDFGTSKHRAFVGTQFVIGKSTGDFSQQSTGSDWHCAVGNNYFIQVAGRKQWEFIDPQYSHMLSPLKGGLLNMWTGNKRISELQRHIPRYITILEPGDMVYNPVWMWHKITNFGGLSIGVPVREVHLGGLKHNLMFSFIVFSNKLLMNTLGVSYLGYPPPSAATEADN